MSIIDLNHARTVAAARAAGLDDPGALVAHIDARMKAARLLIAGMFAAGCAVGFGVHGLLRFILAIP